MVNVKRYYSDHQLYINKLPIEIMPDDVSDYFSKLGKVLNVVFTSNPDKKIEPTNHCFIKFEKD
jgi:RNA recognition motif-containing protein